MGSIEPGKWADLVLWKPAYFGVKAEFVLKGGFIAWSQMGDANASIPTPQPVYGRPMFGALGGALAQTCLTFVSKASLKQGIVERYGLKRQVVPVENCRSIGKKDMKNNNAMPVIEVDPDTYKVTVDGELATCEPASASLWRASSLVLSGPIGRTETPLDAGRPTLKDKEEDAAGAGSAPLFCRCRANGCREERHVSRGSQSTRFSQAVHRCLVRPDCRDDLRLCPGGKGARPKRCRQR